MGPLDSKLNFKVYMKKILFFYLFFCVSSSLFSSVLDLEKLTQDFVLENCKIEIKDYPEAFNPSIVRWNNRILLSFRVLTDPKNLWESRIGLIWLDEDFKPASKPQLLNTRVHKPNITSRSEDARLFTINDQLFVIYNDNETDKDDAVRRMHIAEIIYDGKYFSLNTPECIHSYEGERENLLEKNWIPFDFQGKMLLAYKINPHRVLSFLEKGSYITVASTQADITWKLGNKRLFGGTPAIKIYDEYLAFFHSSVQMVTVQSDRTKMWHYFMGAYTFKDSFPFNITRVSPHPIVAQGMYDQSSQEKRVIFPGGFIDDEQSIWIVYGRDDKESWILKLDKKGLYESLVSVSPIQSVNPTQ